jgi:hypothetical protein
LWKPPNSLKILWSKLNYPRSKNLSINSGWCLCPEIFG